MAPFLLVCVALGCDARAGSSPPDGDLVAGDGFAVTAPMVRMELELLPPTVRQRVLADEQGIRRLISELYRREALAHAARARGLERSPLGAYAVERAEKETLVELWRRAVRAEAVASLPSLDALAREHYLANQAAFQTPEQVRVRHILLRADDGEQAAARLPEAEALLAELAAGASFTDVARSRSEDQGSAAGGGDLGFFSRGAMVQAFEDAAFALAEPGDLSGVVRTRFGLHILKLEERREARQRPFEEVADQIRAELGARIAGEREEAARAEITDPAKAEIDQAAIDALVKQLLAERDARLEQQP